MSNWYPCVICGMARYSHDIVAAPRLKAKHRITQWEKRIGESAVARMIRYPNQDSFICIEHYDRSEAFDEFGQMKKRAKPRKMSEEEIHFSNTYFQDHGTFELYRSDSMRKTKQSLMNVSCSMCSQDVISNDMESHAQLHVPIFTNIFEHLCVKHKEFKIHIDTSECDECSYIQSKAALELVKNQADRCFPMFEFKLVESHLNGQIVCSLEPKIKEDYVNNRPFWSVDISNLCSSSTSDILVECDIKTEVKLEPLDDYENANIDQIDDGHYAEGVADFNEEMKDDALNNFKMNWQQEKKQISSNHYKEKPEAYIKNEELLMIESTSDPEETNGVIEPDVSTFMTSKQRNLHLEMFYLANKHPTFAEMLKIRDLIGGCSRFNQIFHFFESRRHSDGEMCPKDDTCLLARKFLEMEKQWAGFVPEDSDMTMQLVKMFEQHWNSGQRFHNIHSYMMAETLGLPPKYVRYRYKHFTQQKSAQIREEKKEKTAIQKKNSNFSVMKQTSNHIGPQKQQSIDVFNGPNWIPDYLFEDSNYCHKINAGIQCILVSAYLKNKYPTHEEYETLAETVEMTTPEVKEWFANKRKISQKMIQQKYHQERVKEDFTEITEKKNEILTKFVHANLKFSVAEKTILSRRLDLSYGIVTRWIEKYKKNLISKQKLEEKMVTGNNEIVYGFSMQDISKNDEVDKVKEEPMDFSYIHSKFY